MIGHYDKIMKDLRTGEKTATNAEDKANIKRTISMYKQQLDEELAAINGGANPLDVALEQIDRLRQWPRRISFACVSSA